MLLDFSKTFDTLDNSLMLAILQHLGLGQSILQVFKNYFLNRTQTVKVNDNFSDIAGLKCDVPQGPMLGTLLFSLYM